MLLTQHHSKTLTDLINRSLARTAASISELTGCPAQIGATEMTVCETNTLSDKLNGFSRSEIASVHQSMTGPVSADAFLLLDCKDAARFLELLANEKSLTKQLNESDCEALTETGNLLLNDCAGALGDLFQSQVIFSVPRLKVESLDDLLNRLTTVKEDCRGALVIRVSFVLRDHLLKGRIVMAFGLDSFDRLMQEVERREKLHVEV